jgi:hypothetical protein
MAAHKDVLRGSCQARDTDLSRYQCFGIDAVLQLLQSLPVLTQSPVLCPLFRESRCGELDELDRDLKTFIFYQRLPLTLLARKQQDRVTGLESGLDVACVQALE